MSTESQIKIEAPGTGFEAIEPNMQKLIDVVRQAVKGYAGHQLPFVLLVADEKGDRLTIGTNIQPMRNAQPLCEKAVDGLKRLRGTLVLPVH